MARTVVVNKKHKVGENDDIHEHVKEADDDKRDSPGNSTSSEKWSLMKITTKTILHGKNGATHQEYQTILGRIKAIGRCQ